MQKTWKPVIAGLLLFAASIPYCIASTRWFVYPENLPDNVGSGPIWPYLGLIILVPFALPMIAGGICALLRRAWGLAFLGAIVPLFVTLLLLPYGWVRIGPEYVVRSYSAFIRYPFITLVYLMIAGAAVLLYLSRKEFKGRKSSTEHLFSPPKKLKNLINDD
jgi:hypothetical protein